MKNEEWRMENGEWRMENGEWRMEEKETKHSTKIPSFQHSIDAIKPVIVITR